MGKRIAPDETAALLAKLVSTFQIEWNRPDLKMKIETFTKPADPLVFTFKIRNG